MVQGKAQLVIDLGNSETRVMTIFGKTQKMNPRFRISSLRNTYADIQESALLRVPEEYNEENSRIMEFAGGYICNGDLCDTEYGSFSMRPSALEKKYNSDISKMTLCNAFLQGLIDISEMVNTGINSIDVEWDVTVLLPPQDVDEGAKLMAEMVRSITNISFVMPSVKKNITVNSVKIREEGFCAYMGVLFNMNKELRSDYKYLVSETTLVIDIGAGTTDIIIIKNNSRISSTRYTIGVGGNNVHQKVRDFLSERGIPLSESAVKRGVVTGYIKDGSKKISILEEISMAKDEVSRAIVSSIRDFFEKTQFPVREIENLLVCGGGAMDGEDDAIIPISKYIIEYMKRLSQNISLIEFPEVEVDGETQALSPRLLNIMGAGVLSVVD